MGKVIIKIWGDKNKEKKEIGITTDRKDYHAELDGLVWNRDKKGYIKNRSVGYLHKYTMEKWYGEETVEKFYQRGFVIEHINNRHYDNRISNLAFYPKNRNVAKGMYFDKEVKSIENKLLVTIHKDFFENCYQISLTFNDTFFMLEKNDEVLQIYALYLFYNKDISYNTIINEATDIITIYQEKDEIDLSRLRYCGYRVYNEKSDSLFGINLKENDISNDEECLFDISMDDCIFTVVPEEDWKPAKQKNRLYCEVIVHSKLD